MFVKNIKNVYFDTIGVERPLKRCPAMQDFFKNITTRGMQAKQEALALCTFVSFYF